jgi:hypothetical protein
LHFLWSYRKWFTSVFPLQFASPCLGSLCSTTLYPPNRSSYGWYPTYPAPLLIPKCHRTKHDTNPPHSLVHLESKKWSTIPKEGMDIYAGSTCSSISFYNQFPGLG